MIVTFNLANIGETIQKTNKKQKKVVFLLNFSPKRLALVLFDGYF